jgi:hypothetical protein
VEACQLALALAKYARLVGIFDGQETKQVEVNKTRRDCYFRQSMNWFRSIVIRLKTV